MLHKLVGYSAHNNTGVLEGTGGGSLIGIGYRKQEQLDGQCRTSGGKSAGSASNHLHFRQKLAFTTLGRSRCESLLVPEWMLATVGRSQLNSLTFKK